MKKRDLAQTRIRFYLDENLSPEIATQLRLSGIDIIRGSLGADDPVHLERATEMGRVVCTEDDDFLKLAARGIEHAGIIKGVQDKHSIGDWVNYLRFVHSICAPDDMRNNVEHLFPVE
ncbi:MAG: DUF5615 family PIN-like protein [Chloroflexi bacterium]|nr:DUF5615 family PIN-like protein [Chloroflexota bacterium]